MAAHLDPQFRSLRDASDMELVEYTREGDSAAFGELWARHSRAGRAVARSHRFDADDLLSEAFARVFQAISAGGGPTAAFRPYLFTTIRNVSMQWARAKSADASEDLDLIADPSTEEDASLAALDKSLTVSAFRSLPTRWQEALWYSEVEQLTSAEIAPLLGMKANAVSALTYRAREGLRQAWIQAHLKRTTDPECAVAIERLGSFTRGTLGPRESKRVREHLAGCTSCSIVADEARQVGSRLALVLLPLAAGVSGAAGFLSWLQAGSGSAGGMVAAAAMPRSVGVESSSALAPTHGSSSSSAGGAGVGTASIVAGIVGALALAATVVAAATLGPGLWNTPAETAADSSDSSAHSNDSTTDISKVAAPPTADPQASTPPTPPTEPDPTADDPAPSTKQTEPDPSAQPDPEPTSDPVVAPTTPTAPTPPVVVPTTPPDPQTPPVPNSEYIPSDGNRVYPTFTGTGAQPGATIDLVDIDGISVAHTTADSNGDWTITVVDFGHSLTPGSRVLRVTQTVSGRPSDPAFPQEVATPAPTIISPAPDEVFANGQWTVTLTGDDNALVDIDVDRNDDGVIDTTLRVQLVDGSYTMTYGNLAELYRLDIRYVDGLGGYGATQSVRFTVQG